MYEVKLLLPSFFDSFRGFVDLAHFQEIKKRIKCSNNNKTLSHRSLKFDNNFSSFCTFGLSCWPYREEFTAPTGNKIWGSVYTNPDIFNSAYFSPRIRVVGALNHPCWKRFQIDGVSVSCKCKYHIIHSPQGFSGKIYNTGWVTLPDCLRCSFKVMTISYPESSADQKARRLWGRDWSNE